MQTWGCFSCRNPRIAFRVRNCPVCNKPRRNRRFGVLVADAGWVNNGRERHISIPSSDQEQDWTHLAIEAMQKHFQAKLDAASALSAAVPPPPPPTLSLFEQVMQNAQRAQLVFSPRNSRSPEKSTSSHPHANALRQKASVGFRYLQQMRHEQYAVKKLVQAVIDRRTHADNRSESVNLDLPPQGEKRSACPLCEHLFPESQLLGRVTLQAILRWKTHHGLSDSANDERSSSYHRAYSVIRRQNAVALCLFCTQFFDVDLGDSLEVEAIKHDVGVGDYLQGPLHRSNGYYKSQRNNLIRQTLQPIAATSPSSSSSFSSSSSAAVVSSAHASSRPQSRAKFQMELDHLRSRSAQRITSMSQIKHYSNKYFTLDAAQALVDRHKTRNKEGCRIERRYCPVVHLPKKHRLRPSPSVERSRRPAPGYTRQSMPSLPRHPRALDSLDDRKRREGDDAQATTLRERVARMRPTRSLSPHKEVGRRGPGTKVCRPVASLSPRRVRGARRQAGRTFPKRRGEGRDAGKACLSTASSSGRSAKADRPHDLPRPLPSEEPSLPAATRKPLLFAIRAKAQPTSYSTVAVAGLKLAAADGVASQAVLQPKMVREADAAVEGPSDPLGTGGQAAPRAEDLPPRDKGDDAAPEAQAKEEVGAVAPPARQALRGTNKFLRIRSQQLAQAKQQRGAVLQSLASPSGPASAAHASPSPPRAAPLPVPAVCPAVSPAPALPTRPVALEPSGSLPSLASEETASTDRPETRDEDTPRVRLAKAVPPPSAPSAPSEWGGGSPGGRERGSSVDRGEAEADFVPSEPLDSAWTGHWHGLQLDGDIFGDAEQQQQQEDGGVRHVQSRAALRSVGTARGEGMANTEATLSVAMERMKLLSRGTEPRGDAASRTLMSPAAKQRGHSQQGVRKMQLL